MVNKSKNKNGKDATNDNAPPKRRGQASDFVGEHLKFLTKNIQGYIAAAKKKGGSTSKTEGLQAFWAKLFVEYWSCFPWRLPLKEDPSPVSEPVEGASNDPFAALGLNTPEEETKKSEIQPEIKAKIKRWYGCQRPGGMGIVGNPFFAHLSRMRQEEDATPPRRPYMHHPEFCEAVATHWKEEFGHEGGSQHLKRCCEVAKEMLRAEPEDVRERLEKECEETHAKDLEVYNAGGPGEPSPDPEAQRE
ncbi:hypothetical protein K438DRAFT_1990469 [Mycena galopus ATCC 62051]|nr:hypothetical protein K438DRAFT_1990469 [Mycena galopus ATCC 62051]